MHFKVYPVVYAPAIYLALSERRNFFSNVFHASAARVRFVLAAGFSFIALTALAYHFYGDAFLQETYLYHISR